MEQHTIIEIAVIVTDGDMATRIEVGCSEGPDSWQTRGELLIHSGWGPPHPLQGPSIVINQPAEVLNAMNDWSKEHHGKSGLTRRVQDSTVSIRSAELEVLEFVERHVPDQVGEPVDLHPT